MRSQVPHHPRRARHRAALLALLLAAVPLPGTSASSAAPETASRVGLLGVGVTGLPGAASPRPGFFDRWLRDAERLASTRARAVASATRPAVPAPRIAEARPETPRAEP